MADEQEIRVKFTADTSDLERGAKRAEQAARKAASASSGTGTDKAAKSTEKAAKAEKDAGRDAASWKSILGTVSPTFGKIGENADDAFGKLKEGFASTGKGAGLMKAAGVAAIAGLAIEGVQAVAQIGQAIWDAAKDAFKAFDPVQYSKTFGMLQKAVKSLKTALGGLVEGPMTTLVYLATALLQTVTKFIIKLYELMQKIDIFGVLNGWLKDTFNLSEDLSASLDGTLASFDKLNLLGQDSGDQDTRDAMSKIKEDTEESAENAKEINKWLTDPSYKRMDWSTVFRQGTAVSKQLLEALMSLALPDLDWDAFFGDSETISKELMETIRQIAVPEADWSSYYEGDRIARLTAEDLLKIQIPEVDWDAFFGDSETISATIASTLMGIILPVVDWDAMFGDAVGVSDEIAETLLSIRIPEVDWTGFFERIDGKSADQVAAEIGRRLQSLSLSDNVDWDAFYEAIDGKSADEVAQILNDTLRALGLPELDWNAFFSGGSSGSAIDTATVLKSILESIDPYVNWDAFYAGADRTVTITYKEVHEGGSSSSSTASSSSSSSAYKVDKSSTNVIQPTQTKKAENAVTSTAKSIWNKFKDGLQTVADTVQDTIGDAIDDALGTHSPSSKKNQSSSSSSSTSSSSSAAASSTPTLDEQRAYLNALIEQGINPQYATIEMKKHFGLASGGLIAPNSPAPYILGDNTREYEIVSPVSTIVDSVKRAVSEMRAEGGGIGGSQTIELRVDLDGRTIARQIFDPLRTEATRRGVSI